MGYSRDNCYRFKEWYDEGGEASLEEIFSAEARGKSRVAAGVEQAIVQVALDQTACGR